MKVLVWNLQAEQSSWSVLDAHDPDVALLCEAPQKTLVDAKQQLDPATFQEAWERGRRLTPDAALATSANQS